MNFIPQGLLVVTILLASVDGGTVRIASSWLEGENRKVEAWVELPVPCRLNQWSVVLHFTERVQTFETWMANNGHTCVSTKSCEITNNYNTWLNKGSILKFEIQVKFYVSHVPEITARWGDDVCGGTPPSLTTQAPTNTPPQRTLKTTKFPPPGSKYNYAEALGKSILFYEAQRSGKLPENNRIAWRGDSAMDDGKDVRKDLTGGWYDAGDMVKFGFPMASTTTVLAWGMIRSKQAYIEAGEWGNAKGCIKWPLDYFIKCHTSANELYGQVGDGHVDHKYWGRLEDMTMYRPAWKIHTEAPGSDLAGETAAAMAAGSIVFKSEDADYSASLLTHAKQLYDFAKNYRGKYSDSITNARDFYNSYSYKDELAWSAAWLYKATEQTSYLNEAKDFMNEVGIPQEFSWDDKGIGAALLILETDRTNEASKKAVDGFVDFWLNKVKRTPKGLAWLRKWGVLRYAANAAFMLQVAADLGIKPAECQQFALKQINYMLGDGGRSYVVGFGQNPPQRPHHCAASCPPRPKPCNWNNHNSPCPNPNVLNGALVGGPGESDDYVDDRKDYVKNEVTTDYNSGFTSALAGILQTGMERQM